MKTIVYHKYMKFPDFIKNGDVYDDAKGNRYIFSHFDFHPIYGESEPPKEKLKGCEVLKFTGMRFKIIVS